MSKFRMNRRQFLATTGAMGSAALMQPGLSWAGGNLNGLQLRTVGLSVTVQERILNDFKPNLNSARRK